MKNLMTHLISLAALVVFVGLPMRSHAQSFSVASYFGNSQGPVLYCQGNNSSTDLQDDVLYINTLKGNIAAQLSTLQVVGTTKGTCYAYMTGYGYWYATGSTTGSAALISALFTKLPNGQGSVVVTITGYYTGAAIYTSGTQILSSETAMTIDPPTD